MLQNEMKFTTGNKHVYLPREECTYITIQYMYHDVIEIENYEFYVTVLIFVKVDNFQHRYLGLINKI